MSKKSVKRIFIFFLCYLPIQYAMVGVIGYLKAEPWPSFVFPGFTNVFVYDGYYTINNYFLDITHAEHEDATVMPLQVFFDDIPLSMVAGFMRSNLTEQEYIDQFSDETIRWFKQRAQKKTGYKTEQIELVHERSFMKRREAGLVQDSVKVVDRILILSREQLHAE